MYPVIQEVFPQSDFKLVLSYNNGENRLFDLSPYLDFGIFRELKDEKLFKTVRVSFDTIVWDNDTDLDPEFLYNQSVQL